MSVIINSPMGEVWAAMAATIINSSELCPPHEIAWYIREAPSDAPAETIKALKQRLAEMEAKSHERA